ncbi:hypothetical protein QTP88_026972 [Uroleucon formosanum]
MVNVPRFARISIVVDGNACEQHYESLGRNTIQLEGHCERRGIKMTNNPNRRGFVHRVTLNHFSRVVVLWAERVLLLRNLLVPQKNALNCKCDEVKSTRETKTRGLEPRGTKPNYVWPRGKWFIGFVSNDLPETNRFD